MYGYLDYALDLVMSFPELFTSGEVEQLRRAFAAETPFTRKLPKFRGRRRLAKLFLDLHYAFRF